MAVLTGAVCGAQGAGSVVSDRDQSVSLCSPRCQHMCSDQHHETPLTTQNEKLKSPGL